MSELFLIRDDIIPPVDANALEELMFGNFFPWYFLDNTTSKQGRKRWYEVECPMHVHNLYFEGSVNNPGYLQIMERFGFDPGNLIRMKANMMMARRFEFRHTPYHVDRMGKHFTIVYYVNDSDGATILRTSKGHRRVQPRKGRAVLFDGSILHANYMPWRGPRCVINFNFRENPFGGKET